MRISIWRQFSSNHSSNFTAVGKFETPKKASEARRTLEEMLRAIDAAQNARNTSGAPYQNSPTDVEIEFSKDLGVEWNQITLDWAFQADWAVRQIDNWLVVDSVLAQTYNGITPVDSILKALGGVSMFSEEMAGTHIAVNVLASALTMEIADAVYAELSSFFSSAKEYPAGDVSLFESRTPWEPWSEKIWFYPWEHNASRLYWGELTKIDTRIELRNLDFTELGYGLPALLSYLRAKGFTIIEYSFTVAS